jgi:hypothetical protein
MPSRSGDEVWVVITLLFWFFVGRRFRIGSQRPYHGGHLDSQFGQEYRLWQRETTSGLSSLLY